MTKLPRLSGKQVIAALRKLGFDVVRVKGSHHFIRTQMAAQPSFLYTLEKHKFTWSPEQNPT